ncbi:MAG: ABC-three component system middle component 6 [Streptococcus salivarius]
MVYGIMLKGNLNIDSIYQDLRNELKDTLNYDFFILALDFLFLLDKIVVNRRGELEIVY